jgi:16S rRNA (cytosine1402-N4)-methyltransferase
VNDSRFDSEYHAPVLVAEVLADLAGASHVLDGTLGGGGHSLALLEAGADVTGLDRDPNAIVTARARLATYEAAGRFRTVQTNYADAAEHPALAGQLFDGILLDLGVSSHQFDDETRGFSFREGAPLDMRMEGGEGDGRTAADVLNLEDVDELKRIFREYGDEPQAGRLAREVERRRGHRPFETSDDFVGAIRAVFGSRSGPSEFARFFQALRIAVNDELAGLERTLPALRDRLTVGGVFAVIAYHSGEDRLVKHAFREWSMSCICPPKQMVCTCRGRALGVVMHKKPVLAGPDETTRNPRARSAHLRSWRNETAVGA